MLVDERGLLCVTDMMRFFRGLVILNTIPKSLPRCNA